MALRFSSQAKDMFVVRITKMTNRELNVDSSLGRIEKESATKTDNQFSNNIPPMNTIVIVSFQAQLPAYSSERTPRSTSVDQMFSVDNELRQIIHRADVRKGVRLSFSCPLAGNGIKLEDFRSASVSKRLAVWEENMGKTGILVDIMTALQKTVAMMLNILRRQGIKAILPEIDFIFYPFLEGQLRPVHMSLVKGNPSSDVEDRASSVKSMTRSLMTAPSSPGSNSLVNVHPAYTQRTASQSPLGCLGSKDRHNNNLPSAMRINVFNASTMSCAQKRENRSTGATPINHVQYRNSGTQLSRMPLYTNAPNQTNAYNHEGLEMFETDLNRTDFLINNHCILNTKNMNSVSYLQTTPTSEAASSTDREIDYYSWISADIGNEKESLYSHVRSSVSCSHTKISTEFSLEDLINEIGTRLRDSPNRPLIIMPMEAPEAEYNSLSSSSLPLVFQLPRADSIFVGLPSYNGERPRVVTSPVDSAFIVAPKKSDNNEGMNPNCLSLPASSSRFIVASPRPGYMLAISYDGRTYQFHNSQHDT